MQPATKIAQEKILRDLVPLNALSEERFNELAGKIEIVEVKSGHYLFRKGERDNQTVYLLSGKISLVDGFRKIVGDLEAGTDQCRYPLVAQQPRPHSAKAVGKVLIARLDTGLLDVFLTWDQSNPEDATDIGEEDTSDWMTRILQSDAFLKLPPSKLQGLLRKLEPHQFSKGDVVIAEGDEGDYFYVIHEGSCTVTRRNPQGGQDRLAELAAGESFGEEALVSSNRRNATVTMLTDGVLMRLAKQDFVDLLHTQLVRSVSIDAARKMVNDGAVWVDVRTADEYAHGSFEDSVNIPLAELRGELPELVFNASYILCCDTGRRSDSAAFLLSHKGFDVCVLEGGMSSLTDNDIVRNAAEQQDRPVAPAPVPEQQDGGDSSAGSELQQLQDMYTELRGQHEGLQEELAQRREQESRLEEQLEQLRGELGESTGRLGEMYSSIKGHEEEKALLFDQYSALQDEHDEALGSLQALLEREQSRVGDLQAEHEKLQYEYRQLQERVTESAESDSGALAALQAELAGARDRIEALETEVRERAVSHGLVQQAEASAREYEQRSGTLAAELEAARAEIGRLAGLLENAAAEDSGRDGALAGLEQELATVRGQLEEAGARLSGEADASRALREQNDALQNEMAGLQAALDESRQQIGQLTESVGGADAELENRLAELRQELDARAAEKDAQAADRDRLQAEFATLQDENAGLRSSQQETGARLEQLEREHENMLAGRQATDTEFEKLQGTWDEERASLAGQLEEAAHNAATLQAELDRVSAEMEQYRHDHEQLLSQAGQEQATLEQEVATLREQVSVLEAEAQEQLAATRAGLEAAEQQHDRLQAELAEKDKRLEEATLLAGQQEVHQGVLEQELELARQQQADLQAMAEKHEERTRQVEQELQATVSKSHDDLRRKNDNERELQGQIDRLRKKLEQATAEYRTARSEAQDSLDHLREELQAEREARAEERAQMAARQRELKEQLSEVASEHEVNMTNQSGVIEEAVTAMRAEERSRLQSVLEAHAATEEQLVRLQAELKQAHSELASFQREEKNRRQTDIDLMAEQNQLAEAAIGQLQAQLKELVHERDSALEQQQVLREKMNVLRGEVEVARALVNRGAQGVTEDPVKLREQLDETRRNVEMAVRLRGEAETARDRLMEERNRLLVQVENMQAGAIHAPPSARAMPAARPAVEVVQRPAPAAPSTTRQPERTRSPRWQLPVFGLLAVLVILVAGWFLWGDREPSTVDMQAVVEGGAPLPEMADSGPAQVMQSGAEGRQPADMSQSDLAVQPASEQSAAVAEHGAPDTIAEGYVPEIFSDALKIGGRGPEMVRLAPGSFLMGSHGNSINHEEVPRHLVELGGFSISRNEVSFAEYDRFARATRRRLPHDEKWGRGDQPVINVSWHDATAYAEWLSTQTGEQYRLPSEAEWEYAARAGTEGNYWWDDDIKPAPANCFNCGSRWDGARTAPVGQFAANGFGLLDMAGNVQEWTADCYFDSYQNAPVDGSAWTSPLCTLRSVRGGSYTSPLKALRNANRGQLEQDTRLDNLGFRVARDN
jgi:formylglycine-generating enzyme required for sulfatase activity/CRP-like cAMP-binding protein/chromosome segregation ATPase